MAGKEWVPVSYTHLDVYKRQAFCAAQSFWLEDYALFMAVKAEQGQAGLAAVSYTHLDVYKRQAISKALSPMTRRERFFVCVRYTVHTTVLPSPPPAGLSFSG